MEYAEVPPWAGLFSTKARALNKCPCFSMYLQFAHNLPIRQGKIIIILILKFSILLWNDG